MRNYMTIGPVRLRISSACIAPWGYARLMIGPLSLFSRTNDGAINIAAYQRRDETWRWYVAIRKRQWPRGWVDRAMIRTGQWHDYFRMPFDRELIVGHQDYHKPRR